jgi:hypothetical protein
MNQITGDKQFVLQLLKDTARNLAVRHPEAPKPKGAKKAIPAVSGEQQVERDQIIERFQRAYETAQLIPQPPPPPSGKKGLKKGAGKAKALAAPTATVVEDVWYAPRDRTIALFQSAMDQYLDQKSGAPKKAKGIAKKVTKKDAKNIFYTKAVKKKAPAGAKGWVGEQYDNLDPGWLKVALEKAKIYWKGKHKFVRHNSASDFHYQMGNGPLRVALIADWGGGNDHAQAVANQIRNFAPDYVIHLGDVYYAGTDDEVKQRFFGFWPGSLQPGRSFALNSNHEMYSGGNAYFDLTLPRLGQQASYFCLENDNWRLIGLDSAYVDHDFNVEQIQWLTAVLNSSDKKNILFSHHQPFSAYESGGGGEERLQNWTKDLTGKITAWYWGHEHLCVVYKPYKGIKGRCIGHGCFPYEIPPSTPPYAGPAVEWVLRADDPQHAGRGIHGFALLEIHNGNVTASYIDQLGTIHYQEGF